MCLCWENIRRIWKQLCSSTISSILFLHPHTLHTSHTHTSHFPTHHTSHPPTQTCKFCHQKGAATGCAVGMCRIMGHAPCALANGFLFQHYDNFKVFCHRHRPGQRSSLMAAASSSEKRVCSNCRDEVDFSPPAHLCLVCPVCKAGFHRECIQVINMYMYMCVVYLLFVSFLLHW